MENQNNFKMKSRKSRFLKQRVPTIQRMATSRGMSPRATSRNGLPVGLEECIQRLGKELACSICFSAFEDAVVTGCDHYFCERCLASALDARPSCPLCKAPVKRRELRVDQRMRDFVSGYKRVLVAHKLTSVYCSQIPGEATQNALVCAAQCATGERARDASTPASMSQTYTRRCGGNVRRPRCVRGFGT